MKKKSFYFPHFSNARNDQKILRLRRVLGPEGYAIYFMLLEILREQTDFKYPIDAIGDLEFELRISKEKIYHVIVGYDLFQREEKHFFSLNLIENMRPYIEKIDKMKGLAARRWSSEEVKNAVVAHPDSADNSVEEHENMRTHLHTHPKNYAQAYENSMPTHMRAHEPTDSENLAKNEEKMPTHMPTHPKNDAYAYENSMPKHMPTHMLTHQKTDANRIEENRIEENRIEREKQKTQKKIIIEKNFNWFLEQIDEIFLEQMRILHQGKNIEEAARQAFGHLCADEKKLKRADRADVQKLLNTWLSNTKIKPEKNVFSKSKLSEIIESRNYLKGTKG